jgi:predicted amino acid racemase
MAELLVEPAAVRSNTAAVAALLAERGLSLVAVTKAGLGEPAVAEAMLAGGAVALADTRDANLRRLRAAFPGTELHRIYLPPPAGPFVPGDLTYVSSREGALAVARSASADAPARVVVLVETGDRREGVPGAEIVAMTDFVRAQPALSFAGLATNYACFLGGPQGVLRSVCAVAAAARRLQRRGIAVPRVSGGNSSVLPLVLAGAALPPELTELRCGEALLLGQDALFHRPLPGCRQDAVRVRAQVLEGYTKPRRPGTPRRLVLGIGLQDLGVHAVRFVPPGLREVGRSSDYLVVEAPGRAPQVGEMVDMIPSYGALAAAWTSPFVEVRLV